MPSCCIKQCSARKRNNQPTLTYHRFPTNEIMKKKWIEIIGSDNIKPRLKSPFVCSMHFDETSFNRTLDIVRLRDGTVPSSSLLSQHTESTLDLTLNLQPSASATISDSQTSAGIGKLVLQERQENVASEQILLPKNSKTYLSKKCEYLKKKVKQLNEKVRRRDKKIALLSHVIKNLQKRNLLKNVETRFRRMCRTRRLALKTNCQV